jgi:hypothetical protein
MAILPPINFNSMQLKPYFEVLVSDCPLHPNQPLSWMENHIKRQITSCPSKSAFKFDRKAYETTKLPHS